MIMIVNIYNNNGKNNDKGKNNDDNMAQDAEEENENTVNDRKVTL